MVAKADGAAGRLLDVGAGRFEVAASARTPHGEGRRLAGPGLGGVLVPAAVIVVARRLAARRRHERAVDTDAVEVGGLVSALLRGRLAVRLGRRRGLGRLALRAFEQRVLLDLGLDVGHELEVGELQQLDRLLQLRRHDQRLRLSLRLTKVQPGRQCHGGPS